MPDQDTIKELEPVAKRPILDGHVSVSGPAKGESAEPYTGSAGDPPAETPEVRATPRPEAEAATGPLRDAYWGSYSEDAHAGNGHARVVIDDDERTQITNTADYPWRAIASLTMT